MSRPIVVGDRVIVRPECLAQERAEAFDGRPYGRVERIDRDCPEGALARLDGKADDGSGGRSSGRWVALASLERVPTGAPAVALPIDPTQIARALRLYAACEAIDRVADERGFADPTRFSYDRATVAWVGESDGITCRVGTLVSALLHVGGALAAERRK